MKIKNLLLKTFLILLTASTVFAQEIVKDIDIMRPKGSNPYPLAHDADILYFSTAFSAELGLWKMELSTNEPILIKVFSLVDFSSSIYKAVIFKHKLYFIVKEENNGAELWVSDGTEEGTYLFKNIAHGASGSISNKMIVVGDYLYFLATDGTNDGYRLWVSDGTLSNTYPISSLMNFSNNWQLTAYNNGLLYTNGNGTLHYVNAALEVSALMSIPPQIYKLSTLENTDRFVFFAENGWWINDGLDSMVNFFNLSNEANGGIEAFVYKDSTIVFVETLIFGANVWKSDGTPDGNVLLRHFEAETFAGVYSSGIDIINDEIYFYISRSGGGNLGGEVWKTDLTPEGTVIVNTLNIDYSSKIVFDNKLYFSKNHDGNGSDLWVFDGNEATPIYNFNETCQPVSTKNFFAVDTTLFFVTDEGVANQYELWRINAPSQEILLVKDINDNIALQESANPRSLTAFNDKMFFLSGDALVHTKKNLWVTDGMEEGTAIFLEEHYIRNTEAVGDSILIYLDRNNCTEQYELRKLSETINETSLLTDFHSVSNAPNRGSLKCYHFDAKTYFIVVEHSSVNDYVIYGLWETDGTMEGTQHLAFVGTNDCFDERFIKYKQALYYNTGSTLRKINPETGEDVFVTSLSGGLVSGGFSVAGDYLYFVKNWSDGYNNQEGDLWKTDGTDENTIKLSDQFFWPTEGLKALAAYGQVGDYFLFKGKDEAGNYGIWGTNNTAEGTQLLIESSDFFAWDALGISELFEINDQYFFIKEREEDTNQLWRTNGTPEGTTLVKNLPGVTVAWFNDIKKIQNKVFFSLFTETHGNELWVTDGTYDGTRLFFDLNEGEEGSNPKELTVLNDNVLFAATVDGVRELWKFDILTETIEVVKNKDNLFEIYPNPLTVDSKEIYIKTLLETQVFADIKLYNIEGKLLSQTQKWLKPNGNNSIKMPSNLLPGSYLLNLTFDDKTTTLKFILPQ